MDLSFFDGSLLLFSVLSFVSFGFTLLVLFHPNPLYAAFSFVAWLITLSVFYLQIGFEYLAMLQILIYAGAIMVLFIFIMMLLNTKADRDVWQFSLKNIFTLLPLGGIFWMVSPILWNFKNELKVFPDFTFTELQNGAVQEKIATFFYEKHFLVFESLGVLLFVGIIIALGLTSQKEEKN